MTQESPRALLPQKCGPGNGNARCNESTCHVQMAETSVEPIGSLPR